MSRKKRSKPTICIKPPALQLLVGIEEALDRGISLEILPGSHFAQRVKLIVQEARDAGLL